jgi:hypothetical protein
MKLPKREKGLFYHTCTFSVTYSKQLMLELQILEMKKMERTDIFTPPIFLFPQKHRKLYSK